MIRVTLNLTEGPTTRRVTVSAPSLERALTPYGPSAEIVFPIDPEGFFVPENRAQRETADHPPAPAAA